MGSLLSKVGSRDVTAHISRHPSRWKTYGSPIAIIVGIAGLAIGAAGLGGFFHGGALSNLAQLDITIMIASGGGVILLIIGTAIKNRENTSQRQSNRVNRTSSVTILSSSESSSSTHTSDATDSTFSNSSDKPSARIIDSTSVDTSPSIDTQGGVFYGPEAWRKWDIEVLDDVPPVPIVDLTKKDKVLLYIPQRIKVKGKEEKNLTLKVLKEIKESSFYDFSPKIEKQFGDTFTSGRWILIDKSVLPESYNKDYESQRQMVEKTGCTLPSILEAIVLNFMVFDFTGERLYGRDPWTYTYCTEKIDELPTGVGAFGSNGLIVEIYFFTRDCYGAACVRRNFP